MERKGETLRSLGEKTGFSNRTLVKARTDSGISECRLSTLGRIANALKVPLKDLFEDTQG